MAPPILWHRQFKITSQKCHINPVTAIINLKKCSYNLQNEMVSHVTLYLPSIAKLSLHLFDLTLSKLRFSGHLSFIAIVYDIKSFLYIYITALNRFLNFIFTRIIVTISNFVVSCGGWTFCRKTLCRKTFCRTEILPNGQFAERTTCRI